MPIFDILKEDLISEEGIDFDLGSEEETEEAPVEEESGGDAEALVDALMQYAPGKEAEIKNMLKYAANSNPEQDIFDDAFAYFESGKSKPSEEPAEEPTEEPAEEPAPEKAPAPEELAM